MKAKGKPGVAEALKFGLLELLIVLAGLVFVRKEVYLAGKFSAMILHWQEYAFLILMFADGILRGLGEVHGQGDYLSPFRKNYLRYVLPSTLFLFVSCSSLCDKLNAACIREEWWRDLGLVILCSGVGLSFWAQSTKPKEFTAEIVSLPSADDEDSAAGTTGSASPEEAQLNQESPAEESLAAEPGKLTEIAEANQSAGAPNEPIELENSEKELEPNGAADSNDIASSGPWNLLRYPGRSSMLLELVGVSMALSAWMPLVTLPGLFVMFKWELADLEAFRISQFGSKYLNYRKRTWHLIPYIY